MCTRGRCARQKKGDADHMSHENRVYRPAVITVGQEVLYGERPNDNLLWLLRAFERSGIPAAVAMVLPDDEVVIAEHLAFLVSKEHHPIFVSGGIGGTHDDRTRQGIALALRRPLVRHAECFEILARRYGANFTTQRQRMAWLPQGARLIANPLGAPGFFLDSVFAFPGFPEMLHPMAQEVLKTLRLTQTPPGRKTLELTLKIPEGEIAEEVERFAVQHPSVEIGLYPSITPEGPTVCVRCRGLRDAANDWEAMHGFLQKLEAFYTVVEPVHEVPTPL